MTYDAVWTVNHHPSLCGTAKFSHQLAQRLGVPVQPWGSDCTYPLVSLRASEVNIWGLRPRVPFDLFLHDFDPIDITGAFGWLTTARRVFAANVTIADQIRPLRPDVIEAWCPSTIQGNPHRGTINVLTFGMAHKIQTKRYEKLKTLLDATGEDYTVSVSTAIHEGSPWDETALVADRLRVVFADKLRVLGYLADDALARELRDCSAVALFFDPALRANNTSAWAVLEAQKPLITNMDAHSPLSEVDAYDIASMEMWPDFFRPRLFKPRECSWERLMALLGAEVPCAS